MSAALSAEALERKKIRTVIFASSSGTLIEWYDFYIFGSLATILATHFYPKGNDTAAMLSTLATFATGFIVRPFGALVFGRIGDRVGRKHAFLLTLLLMGGATMAVGLIPNYSVIGIAAPILLVLLRMVQGLALGGEYGGAATYVAEHAPPGQKGYFTSFIQTTATLGLFVSLGVVLGFEALLGKAAFEDWGWRLPFFLSAFLVVFSYFIRRKLEESPVFAELKATGKTSANPLRESFLVKENLRLVLIALFGATAGQGVVWYTGQFNALFFLQDVRKIDRQTASTIVAAALVLATPFFIVFGRLSDRIGRKKIMLTGCALAVACYYPIYMAMASLTENKQLAMDAQMMLIGLVFVQVLFVTMVYGPIAAFLVELFPAKIRYTSMSLPYHIGNGVFGGLVPFIGKWMSSSTGNILAGLWYPMGIATLTLIIGSIFIHEKRSADGFVEET